MEIHRVINSMVPLIQEGLLSNTSESMCMKYLVKLAQEKCVVMRTDHPDMTIAVAWMLSVKPNKTKYNGLSQVLFPAYNGNLLEISHSRFSR